MAANSVGPIRVTSSENLAKIFHVASVVSATPQSSKEGAFGATRLRSETAMPNRSRPVAAEAAFVISVRLANLAKGCLRYWLRGKEIDVPFIPRHGLLIHDLEDNPLAIHYASMDSLYLYMPRSLLQDIAEDLGVRPLGKFIGAYFDPDPFISQFTGILLSHLARTDRSDLLLIDSLGLLLGAHLLQHYGKSATGGARYSGGLSKLQRHRATELLRENLAGRLPIKALASECGLSSSHFARAFRTSFGTSVHKWLIQQRLEHAKALMASDSLPLSDIALRSGFADQSAFTRAFVAALNITPGRWRRTNRNGTLDAWFSPQPQAMFR